MTPLEIVTVIGTVLGVAIVFAGWAASRPRPTWPTATAREHVCFHCRVGYTRAWQLDQHNAFHHPRPDVEAMNGKGEVLKGYRLGGGERAGTASGPVISPG